MEKKARVTTLTKGIPQIAVVITVLNEAATILNLLSSLEKQTLQPSQVVIADGGSTDQTISLIHQWQQHHPSFHIQLLTQPGNRSRGRNAAVQATTTDWIAVTDAGCEPNPEWLSELWSSVAAMDDTTFEKNGWPVVAGYAVGAASSAFQAAVIPYALVMPNKVNPKRFLPATRSLLMHRMAWKKIGGFQTDLSDNEDYAAARKWQSLSLERPPQIQLLFAQKAVVTWYPRSNLKSFAVMIGRFARGDAQAGLFRPKVLAIFARYFVGLLVVFVVGVHLHFWLSLMILLGGLFFYCLWAVLKNYRFASGGWYYLPLLQFCSDGMVVLGTILGLVRRWRRVH